MELSVIIVNYNGISYLKNCFESLQEHLSNILYEIIVVDNNSKDNSCSFIKEHFKEVKLIQSKENLGFGKANNLGVENANGKTILLLNNDTIIKNHLEPAIKTLYASERHGIIAINMLNAKKEYLSAVGRFPSPIRLLKISLLNDERKVFKSGIFETNLYDVDWVTGAFMLIRKLDYEKINGFDNDYFMYVEDVDLCKRMKDIGKKCIFQSNLSYIHFVGFNKSKEILLLKGLQIYASKHFSKKEYIVSLLMLSINKTVKKLKSLFELKHKAINA